MYLRRSMLFMPATNQRAMDKARDLPADCIVFDLEDAVDVPSLAAARRAVSDRLARGGYAPRTCLVRINHPSSPEFSSDIDALSDSPVNGVVIPKVESEDDIRRVQDSLTLSNGEVHAMIETPLGVRRVFSISDALNDGDGLLLGTQDLARQLRLPTHDAEPGLRWSLSRCVVAARASGLSVVDGVYPNFKDPQGFVRQCETARQLGFDGKSVIHPSQLAPCNAHFSPSQADIDSARDLVDLWDKTKGGDAGVVSHGGQMVEALHVRTARELLEYEAILRERASSVG